MSSQVAIVQPIHNNRAAPARAFRWRLRRAVTSLSNNRASADRLAVLTYRTKSPVYGKNRGNNGHRSLECPWAATLLRLSPRNRLSIPSLASTRMVWSWFSGVSRMPGTRSLTTRAGRGLRVFAALNFKLQAIAGRDSSGCVSRVALPRYAGDRISSFECAPIHSRWGAVPHAGSSTSPQEG